MKRDQIVIGCEMLVLLLNYLFCLLVNTLTSKHFKSFIDKELTERKEERISKMELKLIALKEFADILKNAKTCSSK